MAIRVTLVNYIGEIVLDTLVQPYDNVTIFHKKAYHGISER